MPPKKKAAAADAAPTRSSTRTKKPASTAAAKPASSTKPKSKRARADSDDEDDEDDAPAKKPASKKAKKAPAKKAAKDDQADDDDEDDDDDAPAKKPASKKAKKAPAKKAAKDDQADDDEDEDDAPAKKPASKKAKKAPAKKAAKDDPADDDADDDAPAPAPSPPAKMVTVVKRGKAPVDEKSGKVDTHQVYSNDEGVWEAMLNQTNVGKNNNKFYVVQLLHPIGNDAQSILYTRWGRVGADGQTQIKGPFNSATAVSEFKKQFKSKAGVNWEDRVGMVPKSGKYCWLERDYGDEDEDKDMPDASGSKKDENKEDEPIPDCTLAPEIQELCKLIFSTTIIDATLSSMNYDANKLPLGKLSKATILKGFAALKTLSEVIESPNGDTAAAHGGFAAACNTLSGAYYSIIPHDFGRNRPVAINTQALLKKELELVDALGDMEIASKLIASSQHKGADGKPVNPLDANFLSLGLSSMEPVQRASDEFNVLEQYVKDTHGHTHHHIKAKVLNAFRVERSGETIAWKKGGFDKVEDGERFLLWHGSRSTNFAGILKQGLRIAPPEAPVTGYMFGKGVYFADMMSKSAGYCYSSLSRNIGLLLLCEVAAKPFYELTHAEYDADKGCKNNNKRATKGLGRSQPGGWKDAGKALGNDELIGCHMPDGPAKDTPVPNGGYLQYNEYIVYDASQIRLKYLLMVQM